MFDLIKLFFFVLIMIFLVPMVWFLFKEMFWCFGISLTGLFDCVGGFVDGWFLLTVLFVVIIIWLLSI